MKTRMMKIVSLVLTLAVVIACFASCGSESGTDASTGAGGETATVTNEDLLKTAANAGKIGNWGLGNQYEIQALLTKYGLPTDYLSQAFDMDGIDSDEIWLASAMTYNELGLIRNDYEGGYGYGDDIGIIDMNEEDVAMLEDMLFCTKEFAQANPNTVKAFISASVKGWKYACEHPSEAAEIVYEYGSSVSADHQVFMTEEVKKLVETDMSGNAVTEIGKLDDGAIQQTIDLAKKYITLEDSAASTALSAITLDDIRDASYYEDAANYGTPEKTSVSIQLKWLPQAQFMGYFVADKLGYYKDVGLTVDIVSGGGDVSETVAVQNGTVDFGVTWVSNLISANASGSTLVEVAQIYQRSGLVLCYKKDSKDLFK